MDEPVDHSKNPGEPEDNTIPLKMLEYVNAGQYFVDNNWRFRYINRKALSLFGRPKEELLGKTLYEINPQFAGTNLEQAFLQARDEGQPVKFEDYYAPRQNWYEIHINPMPEGYAVYLHDIRGRKEFEEQLTESLERYRFLSEATLEGIILHDRGLIVDANQRIVDLIGYPLDEVLGRSLLDFVALGSQDQLKQRLGADIEGVFETDALHRDGCSIPVRVTTRRARFKGKAVRVAIIEDLRERKAAEERLRKTQNQLQQAQRMESIGRLAGGIAHDFNNLLTAIMGYSELALLRAEEQVDLASDLAEIQKAAGRAANLTRQLLAFSRQQVLQRQVLNLNNLVMEMDKLLQRLIGEDVELVSLLDPALSLARLDPGQFEQVIMNLAVNARDAMPGGGKLTIETANIELDERYLSYQRTPVKTGQYVMLAVSDTGTGMDQATLAQIFEPFFTTKEVGKGTGLGLSTVFGIIQQHEGYIYVYSELGLGTTFKIYLPVYRDPLKGKESRMATNKLGPFSAKSVAANTETILVVEDEEMVRQLIQRTLTEAGYNLLVAADGVEALKLLDNYAERIHLVLTDIIMPNMGGPELISQIRKRRRSHKQLCMSGYTDRVMERHQFLTNCTNFIQKPFTPTALLKRVRETLDS